MHCKKCDAAFYLDASGKPILGEPPAAKGAKAAAKAARSPNEPLDPIGIVAGYLAKLPKPFWYTVLGAFTLYLLYFGYSHLGSGGSAPTPEADMETQIAKAAEAFVHKDLDALKKLTPPDSFEDMAKLVEAYQPKVVSGAVKPDEVAITFGRVEEGGDEPYVNVNLLTPGPPGEKSRNFNLFLCWFQDNGRWWLNGTTSLEATKKYAEAVEKRDKAIAKAKK